MSSLTVLLITLIAVISLGLIIFRHLGNSWQLELAKMVAASDITKQSDSTDGALLINGQLFDDSKVLLKPNIYPAVGSAAGFLLSCVAGVIFKDGFIPALIISVPGGYLGGRFLLNKASPNEEKALLFHLPMAVEKILIAVQSGLDVVPALRIASDSSQKIPDPASRAFRKVVQIIEQGATVESALEKVASEATEIPLKHVLLHLKVAHSRGGDLTFPLRELADATQITYEQTIDEEIAVLPIKATAPLLCTFLGLLILFLTAPIVGVVIAAKSGANTQMNSSLAE